LSFQFFRNFAFSSIDPYIRRMERTAVNRSQLDAAFDDIITGTGVQRSKHELIIDRADVTYYFLAALKRHGFFPTTVGDVEVQPGERVPAFFIEQSTAYFGWVFWEKFTHRKMRKLWGSVVRNKKGDWAIQIPPTKPTTIYANPLLKIEMDIEHPGEW
jgi:hypothetical protein